MSAFQRAPVGSWVYRFFVLCLVPFSVMTPVALASDNKTSADDPPPAGAPLPRMAWLFEDVNNNAARITVSGWAQMSYAQGSEGEVLLPASFFRKEDGFTLDQAGIFIERVPKSNIDARVGPFPGPAPDAFDWGFNLTLGYGSDNFFFRTYGWDDNLSNVDKLDGNEYFWTVTQAFLDFYFPILGGSNLKVGLFHTPLENEIGFALPAPAPTDFYTHPYTFAHGPAKHFGALWSSKLVNQPGDAMWAVEVGVVQGWNNVQDPNNDLDVILNLRWRSPDFATWVDVETIYGNGADDAYNDCPCGSGIVADSALAGDDDLARFAAYFTITHTLANDDMLIAEANYGHQQKALFPDLFNDETPGVAEEGGEDGNWWGLNVSWIRPLTPSLSWKVRAEFFDTDGVHVITPFAGEYRAITTNLTWNPARAWRIRPEIRFDSYSGNATPFGANNPPTKVPPIIFGEHTRQWIYSMDVTFFF